MVPEMEKPRITEIKVRMDCNGCVNKIKKALHGITGIYDTYIDFPQQKITVIGWADPQILVKAIKKTRKSAIICSHIEQSDQPAEPTPETGTPNGGATPPESTDPPVESTQTEATQTMEEPKEQPLPESSPPEENPSPESSNDATTSQLAQPPMPKDREEVHVIHRHPPTDYGYQYPYGPNFQQGYSGQWIGPHGDLGYQGEPFQPPRPVFVTHSYNTNKPSPYVTEYAYPRSPPRYAHYSEQWNRLHGDPGLCAAPGFRGEPSQPPRPVYATHSYNTYKSSPYVPEYAYPQSPSRYSHYSEQWNGLHSDPGIRGEPSQPSRPVYATQSYNTYKSSPYVTEYAYPRSPLRSSHYSEQWNGLHSDPGIRGEPSQPPQPIYATQSYNTYKSSPCVTGYAYPRSPPTYSHYSRPDHYREDYYYSGNNGNGNGNGNITSMFSDENPNACRII